MALVLSPMNRRAVDYSFVAAHGEWHPLIAAMWPRWLKRAVYPATGQ